MMLLAVIVLADGANAYWSPRVLITVPQRCLEPGALALWSPPV